MYKVAILADLTSDQLSHLRSLAQENNIQASFVVESSEEEPTTEEESFTPLTGEMFDAVAEATGSSLLELIQKASRLNLESIEDALRHEDVPSSVKEVLEDYL